MRHRRFESCPSDVTSIDNPAPIDPKPFYRAVLTSHAAGAAAIDEHPLEHRPGLVWNGAIKSIKHWFRYRSPGQRPRNALLALYAAEAADFETTYGFDPLPIVVLYIGVAFTPDRHVPLLAKVPMEASGEVGLAVPAVIARHYAWRAGEREALIASMSVFDHTFGRMPSRGERS